MPAEESYRIGCKLYVSMTRAKQELYLSYSSELSDWLNSQSILEKLDVNQEWHWHIDVDEHRSFK